MSLPFTLLERPTHRLPAWLAAGTLVLASVPLVAQDPETNSPTSGIFTGLWLLDERYSDDPQERVEELSAGRGSRLGTSSPRGGFGGGRGGRRQGQATGMVGPTVADLIEHIKRGLTILQVDQNGQQPCRSESAKGGRTARRRYRVDLPHPFLAGAGRGDHV